MPASRTLLVSITLQPKSDEVTFRIPAWCPGYYFILNYQNKLSGFSAVDPEGHPLEVEHADPRAWQVIDPGHRPITVSYRIMSDDPGLGFFGVNVRAAGAFVNGAAAFLYADGYQTEPDRLHVDMPEGWAIATAMDHAGETDFAAAGYDELIDHPIEMGRFARRTFKVLGIPFEAVFVAPDRANCNIEAETERLRELSVPAIRMFGSAPFRHYIYIVHLPRVSNRQPLVRRRRDRLLRAPHPLPKRPEGRGLAARPARPADRDAAKQPKPPGGDAGGVLAPRVGERRLWRWRS
ncbi:MAG: hypothetical protein HYR64_00150 [Fimbriimonas ginsengisoli]|uniref:Peptidase M61 N-terminal domain-containing protein n=1 Tax=Fimbriimonas ginsengisoli TaxID=1005039 RepID=A0A931PTI8_FIMGI|nr:hypothetical protein [Fimbriimonas ginsengisoli]